MTDSPSEPMPEEATDAAAEADAALSEWTASLSAKVGGDRWVVEFGTPRIYVDRARWVDALRAARDAGQLTFFSWLSAIDWSREVEVGEPAEDADTLEERYEVIARISSIRDASGAHFVATLPKDNPSIDSIVSLWPGAGWHEREAAEMFGIDFVGNPNLTHLYLPDSFEGHPLRKSFALLSREVKPWPGTVDVEAMPDSGPSTENPEAGDDT